MNPEGRKKRKGETRDVGEYASMSWAALGLTSEQVTFALLIALGLFFLYLQLQRFARLASRDNPPPDASEDAEDSDKPDS